LFKCYIPIRGRVFPLHHLPLENVCMGVLCLLYVSKVATGTGVAIS